MPSLVQPPARSYQKRIPLQERPQSETNKNTIRIVRESDNDIYSRKPFPTYQSQILRPPPDSTFIFHRKPSGVSDENVDYASAVEIQMESRVPQPLKPRKLNKSSTPSRDLESEVARPDSSTLPSSTYMPEYVTPPLPAAMYIENSNSPGAGPCESTIAAEMLPGNISRQKTNLEKSVGSKFHQNMTIRKIIPSVNTVVDQSLPSQRGSVKSLTSSSSTDTLGTRRHTELRGSPNFVVYSGKKNNQSSTSLSLHQSLGTPTDLKNSLVKTSLDSFVTSECSLESSQERPRSASCPPTPDAMRRAENVNGTTVRFPIRKFPGSSGQWADVSEILPKRYTRADQITGEEHWSSQLSTINSESEVNSEFRSSRTPSQILSGTSDLHYSWPHRRATLVSVSSTGTGMTSLSHRESSMAIPPLFYKNQEVQEHRDSEECKDTVGDLPSSATHKCQKPGNVSSLDNSIRSLSPMSNASLERHGSTASRFARSIPAWARSFYSRERTLSPLEFYNDTPDSRINTGRSSAPTNSPIIEHFGDIVYSPRNRPRKKSPPQMNQLQNVTDDMAIEVVHEPGIHENSILTGPQRSNYNEPFIPRLTQSRHSEVRLSTWTIPSLCDQSLIMTRDGRQIFFFCLGFILPIAWMVAAFLPLPFFPKAHNADIEKTVAETSRLMDEKRYWKARWWRNLNRVMSVFGVTVLVSIITVSVVSTR